MSKYVEMERLQNQMDWIKFWLQKKIIEKE
jgi:hypothetical protein